MKKLIIGFVLGAALTITSVALAGSPIHLIVNGEDITSEAAPVIIDGKTLVPARALAEKLGASVTWDAASNSVVVTSDVQIGGVPTDLEETPENSIVVTETEGEWLSDIIRKTNISLWSGEETGKAKVQFNKHNVTIEFDQPLTNGFVSFGKAIVNGETETLESPIIFQNRNIFFPQTWLDAHGIIY